MTAFGQFKAIFDPDNRMNPGKVVAPYRIDENLRLGASWTPRPTTTRSSSTPTTTAGSSAR